MMDKLKRAVELALTGSIFLIISFSPVTIGFIEQYNKLAKDFFTKIFNVQPDNTMIILYMFLPFVSLHIILEFLYREVIKFYNSRHHKIFNALWFSKNGDILDIFLIYDYRGEKSLFKLMKNFQHERYNIETEQNILGEFKILHEWTFHTDRKDEETSITALIPTSNHKNPNEKIFVEICLHLYDKKYDYVSVFHNFDNEKNYFRADIEKHKESNELLELRHKEDKFKEKYDKIVEKLIKGAKRKQNNREEKQ